MTIVLSLKIQQHFKTNVFHNKKESENQKEKVNFENSSFQFESHLFSEVKGAQTHTAGFSAKFHFKPEIRTNNGDNLENISSDDWIGDFIYWSNRPLCLIKNISNIINK